MLEKRIACPENRGRMPEVGGREKDGCRHTGASLEDYALFSSFAGAAWAVCMSAWKIEAGNRMPEVGSCEKSASDSSLTLRLRPLFLSSDGAT